MPSPKGILRFMYGLERHGIKPGLERISALLKELGDPHKKISAVHVAGTNGKGSVSAMVASILAESGFKTGLYTSPHLIRFNERIRVSGRTITDKELVSTAGEVKKACKKLPSGSPVTFFEFTTAMAFLHFRQKGIDLAVIETGMGGRFDATNVVCPEVSVITNIGIDHTDYLGGSLREIAFEKAGIIKPRVPVVTGEQRPAPLSVIRAAAKKTLSQVYVLGADFKAEGQSARFDYSGIATEYKGMRSGLLGPHQVRNAALALAVTELLRVKGLSIKKTAVKSGLEKVSWPGRLEVLGKRPLVIIDGAHNPSGARALKEALLDLKKGRLILVLGIMADKDIDSILNELAPAADIIIAARPAGERSAATGLLMEKLKKFPAARLEKPVVKEACRLALSIASPKDTVCVTGSLFTAGEAREYLRRVLAV